MFSFIFYIKQNEKCLFPTNWVMLKRLTGKSAGKLINCGAFCTGLYWIIIFPLQPVPWHFLLRLFFFLRKFTSCQGNFYPSKKLSAHKNILFSLRSWWLFRFQKNSCTTENITVRCLLNNSYTILSCEASTLQMFS